MFDNRFKLQLGKPHLVAELGGKRIAFAYIRKNACSSFKVALGYPSTTRIRPIWKKHFWFPWQKADAVIFVYRDPIERLVSLYRRNIIEGRPTDEITERYRETMMEEPTDFERFVDFACRETDPHCWRQSAHLFPIRYTHAIHIEKLHETMCSIIGDDAASPFARRVNSSSPAKVEVSEQAASKIRDHYAQDFAMLREISYLDGAESSLARR